MDQRVLWFVLLLPALSCLDPGTGDTVTIRKTIGREQDAIAVCGDSVDFAYATCTIKTERGKGCYMSYVPESGYRGNCDSNYRLMTENQIAFLYLTGLTPEDSGIYSCQCSRRGGTYFFNLNITVEDPAELKSDSKPALTLSPTFVLIALCAFTFVAGLVIGFTVHKICSRNNPRTEVSVPPASVLLSSEDQIKQENPYESLQEPASDVYQTISSENAKKNDTATRDHDKHFGTKT